MKIHIFTSNKLREFIGNPTEIGLLESIEILNERSQSPTFEVSESDGFREAKTTQFCYNGHTVRIKDLVRRFGSFLGNFTLVLRQSLLLRIQNSYVDNYAFGNSKLRGGNGLFSESWLYRQRKMTSILG